MLTLFSWTLGCMFSQYRICSPAAVKTHYGQKSRSFHLCLKWDGWGWDWKPQTGWTNEKVQKGLMQVFVILEFYWQQIKIWPATFFKIFPNIQKVRMWNCLLICFLLLLLWDLKHFLLPAFLFFCRDDEGNLAGDNPQSDVHVAQGLESPNSYLDQECRGRFPLVEEDAILYCYEYDQNQEVSSVRRGSTPTYGKPSSEYVCVCVGGGDGIILKSHCASLLQEDSGPSRCRWNTTGRKTAKTWPSWRERAGEVSGRRREKEKKKGRQRKKGREAEVSGRISHNILTLSHLGAKNSQDELACQNW